MSPIFVWNHDTWMMLIGLGVTGLIVFLVFALESRRYQRCREFLEREARKFNGKVISESKYSIPSMRLIYHDIELHVYVTPMRSGRVSSQPSTLHVLATFPWQTPYWFCIYFRNNPPVKFGVPEGGASLFMEKFAEGFTLQCNDRDFAQSLLTNDCRKAIKQIMSERPVLFYQKDSFRLSLPFPLITGELFAKIFEPVKIVISRLNELGQYQ